MEDVGLAEQQSDKSVNHLLYLMSPQLVSFLRVHLEFNILKEVRNSLWRHSPSPLWHQASQLLAVVEMVQPGAPVFMWMFSSFCNLELNFHQIIVSGPTDVRSGFDQKTTFVSHASGVLADSII